MDQDEAHPQSIEETEYVGKLRRFALAVGAGLLLYVIGGGEFRDEIQGPITAIVHLKRPWVLSWLLMSVSVYAGYRYWYHGIHRSLTRTKIRSWFCTPQAILFFGGTKSILDNFENNAEGPLKNAMYLNHLQRSQRQARNRLNRSNTIVLPQFSHRDYDASPVTN